MFALCAFSLITSNHDTPAKVDSELKNIYDTAQPRQYKTVVSTPNLGDLQDGEMVLASTGAIKIFFRVGQEIYAISGSCVTVRR